MEIIEYCCSIYTGSVRKKVLNVLLQNIDFGFTKQYKLAQVISNKSYSQALRSLFFRYDDCVPTIEEYSELVEIVGIILESGFEGLNRFLVDQSDGVEYEWTEDEWNHFANPILWNDYDLNDPVVKRKLELK